MPCRRTAGGAEHGVRHVASDKLPSLCMLNRSQGTPSTAWVVQGGGFAPQSSLTVWLT